MNFSTKIPLLLLIALSASSVTTATRIGRSDIKQEKGDNKNMIRSSRKLRRAGDKLKNKPQNTGMIEERVLREDLEIDDLLFLEADTYDHILAVDALADSITAEMEEEFDADFGDEFDDDIDLFEEELDYFEEEEENGAFDARSEGGEDDGKRMLSWGRRYFYIRNEETGKYLEVAGGSCHNGNNIHLWHFTGSSAQQFYWHRHNGKSYLVNACCHKVVEIAHGSCVDGANIHLWNYIGDSRQVFRRDGLFLANPTCHTAMEAENDYHHSRNVQSSWYNRNLKIYEPSKYWHIQYI